MSQFSNDIDSLSKYGLEDLDSAAFDRILGYTKSGKISEADINSISKLGLEKLDSSSIDRVLQIVDKENIKQPSKPVQEKVVPKSAGEQILDFGRRGVEASFPRLTQNTTGEITPSEVGKDVLRGSLDALSFIPRSAIASSQTAGETLGKLIFEDDRANTIKNMPSRFVENLGVIETPKGTGVMGVVEDVARGPFIAAPGVGSFVPKTASLLPKIAAGIGDVALGAGLGTAESVASNEGVNPLGVGIGGVLGAIGPVGRGVKGTADYVSNRSVGDQMIKHFQEQLLNGNDVEKLAAKTLLIKYGDDPVKLADKLNEMIPGFAGNVGDETANRAIKRNVKWIDPSTPGPLSNEPILRAWTKPASVPPTMLDVFGSSLPGIGSLYAASKTLYNSPHFASDATRFLPKGTSTAIRNLGIGVIGSQRKEQ